MQQQPYAVANAGVGHDKKPVWGARIGAFAAIAIMFVIFRLVQWRGPLVLPLAEAAIAAAVATWLADRIYRGVGSAGINAMLLVLSALLLDTIGGLPALPLMLRALPVVDIESVLVLLLGPLLSFAMSFVFVGFIATYVPAVLRRRRERLAAADTVADNAAADTTALQIPAGRGEGPQVRDYSQTPVAAPAPSQPRELFLSRHWRGGYPLDTSLWIFGILLTIVRVGFFLLMMIGLYVAFDARGVGLIVSLWVLIFFEIFVAVWQAGGIGRSAASYVAQGGGRIIAVLASGAVLLIVLVSTARDVVDATGAIKTLLSRRY